jgi:hypothetical protein
MTLLRSLLSDLVEKRLWPVALLLAIAVAAVPLALGHGGQAASDAPVVLPAAPPDAATPAVKLVGPAAVRSRTGTVRDPFRRAKKEKKATATAAGKGADPGSGSGSTPAAKSGAADAPADAAVPATTQTATTGGTAAKPAASGASVYRPRVRWGQDANAAIHGVSRLQPLGGLSNPALLYLGTTKAGSRVVFLLGPNASVDGDSTCAEKTCRVVRLKAGDTTVVTVQAQDGGEAHHYTLVIDDIARSAASSQAAAAKLRARVHHDGRDVLHAMIKDAGTAAAIGQFRFDRSLGAVVAVSAP